MEAEMELKLDEKEVKNILLAWAETQFGPKTFNSVDFEARYNHIDCATLEFDQSLIEPPKSELDVHDEGIQA
jgi:hypothetical protein